MSKVATEYPFCMISRIASLATTPTPTFALMCPMTLNPKGRPADDSPDADAGIAGFDDWLVILLGRRYRESRPLPPNLQRICLSIKNRAFKANRLPRDTFFGRYSCWRSINCLSLVATTSSENFALMNCHP